MQGTLIEMESITKVRSIRDVCTVNPLFAKYEAEIFELLEKSGAILKGHFQLLSGLHSEYFLRFSKISALSENVKFLANIICDAIPPESISKVISPDTAGVTLAYEIARRLKLTRITAKTDHLNRPTKLINHIELEAFDQVLLVNDLSSTFTGLEKMIELVLERKAHVSSIALFASRSAALPTVIPQGVNAYVVTDMFTDIPLYGEITNIDTIRTVDHCPLCKEGLKIIPSWELN